MLTLLLFLILLILVFICADLEKRRKETARYEAESVSEQGYIGGALAYPTMGLTGIVDYPIGPPGMVEIRDDESDPPLSREAFEKMPSARF